MTPITSLIAAKACISMSEAHELHKEFDKAIKQAQQAVLFLSEWQYMLKAESERQRAYRGADFDNAAVQQYRYDSMPDYMAD
jgi:hypothetical protein